MRRQEEERETDLESMKVSEVPKASKYRTALSGKE